MATGSELSDLGPGQDPLVGQVLAERYRLVRRLGRGGMGSVYEGLHQVIGKRVAVKLLHPQFASDPEIVTRFLTEARAAATLRHPSIVEALDVGRAPDGTPFLVLEFLDGQSLQEVLKARPQLSAPRAVAWLRPVVSALGVAHRQGIVHRDLKPDNLFLAREGDGEERLKVVDFGISKIEEGTGAGVTQTGQVIGTPGYMAPEVMLDSSKADARADVFAIGVILYQVLSGARPFARRSIERLAEVTSRQPAMPLAERCPALPPELVRIVDRCLAYEPADRFGSMEELGLALDRLGSLSDADPTATGRGGAAGEEVPAARPRLQSFPPLAPRRKARIALVLVPVLIAAAAGLAVLQRRAALPAGGVTVALAPFYGADADAMAEAQAMRSLAGRALRDALRAEKDLHVVEPGEAPPRSEQEARDLAQRLGAAAILWGEALVFRGEVELQPYVTPAAETLPIPADLSVAPLHLGLTSADGLEQRKGKAAELARRVTDAVALSLLSQGHSAAAMAALDHLESPDARSVLLQSYLLERSGHARQSIAEAVKAGIARWPEDAALHDRLGRLLLADGSKDLALAECQRAAVLQPRDATFRQGVSLALKALGADAGGDSAGPTASRPIAVHDTVLARFEARRLKVESQAREALPIFRQLEADLGQDPFFTTPRPDADAADFLNPIIPWEASPLEHKPGVVGKLVLPDALLAQLKAWDQSWPKHYREVNVEGIDFSWMKELQRYGRWNFAQGAPIAEAKDAFLPLLPIPNMIGFQRYAKLRLMQAMAAGHPEEASREVQHLAWIAYASDILIGGAIAAAILRMEGMAEAEWVAEGHSSPDWHPMSKERTVAFRRVIFGAANFGDPQVPLALITQVFGTDPMPVGRCSARFEILTALSSIQGVGDPAFAPWEEWARTELGRSGPCPADAPRAVQAKRMLPLDRALLAQLRGGSAENDDILDASSDDLAKAFTISLWGSRSGFDRLLGDGT